jgi:glucose-1-phosphate thymidylyltransferase
VTMWGIVPAAGLGSRIQPLGCSKELLPVGSRMDNGTEKPRAIAEYLVERLVEGGAERICFVIAPGKSDIVAYFRGEVEGVPVCYAVQPEPRGLCDALFRALPLVGPDDEMCVGLPDTLWFPIDGLARLPSREFSFLLFPVAEPQLFDAVVTDDAGLVAEIQVKQQGATSDWIWGGFRLPGRTMTELHALWRERRGRDEYFGTLVNEHIRRGGAVHGVRAGEVYVDVGTLHGYREAVELLAHRSGIGLVGHAPSDEEWAR